MTTTLDAPPSTKSTRESHTPQASGPAANYARDGEVERHSGDHDSWTVAIFAVAVVALLFSLLAVGFGARAIDQSKQRAPAAPVAAAGAAPVPVALTSVTLGDMSVTPSSMLVASGTYTVNITNGGKVAHELLVFHTDMAPANLPVGSDGKVAEDAPGFKVSDGDNLDPGASQSRIIDLTEPGIYLFVCNLPGHFMAGMHTIVTVK